MNPLSLLVTQNRSYDSKVSEQAQDLFERISKAIIKDQNHILYEDMIYPVNRCILFSKGYFVEQDKVVWSDFKDVPK